MILKQKKNIIILQPKEEHRKDQEMIKNEKIYPIMAGSTGNGPPPGNVKVHTISVAP